MPHGLLHPDPPKKATIKAAPRGLLMEALYEHAPGIHDGIRAVQRELRPVPGANPITALAGLLGIGGGDNALGIIEGPARAMAGLAGGPGRDAVERIVAASYRHPDGRIFDGTIHADAEWNAMQHGWQGEEMEAGFRTSTGRFVTREEAAEIARRQGILKSQQELGFDPPPGYFDSVGTEDLRVGLEGWTPPKNRRQGGR